MVIGKRVLERMDELGMLCKQFEDATGVRMGTVRSWLRGDRMPNADSVVRCARGLGVTSDWLLGLSDEKEAVRHG